MPRVGRILLAIAISIAAGLLTYFVSDTAELDAVSKRYADSAILAITDGWQEEQLVARGTPGLKEEAKQGGMHRLFKRLSEFGERTAYEGAQGQAMLQLSLSGRTISASYTAVARFKRGVVKVEVYLVRLSGTWLIQAFHVDARMGSATSPKPAV